MLKFLRLLPTQTAKSSTFRSELTKKLFVNPSALFATIHNTLLYRPKMQINFGKEGKFHLYHSEGGERFLSNCTRLNMLFIAGNSILLLLEVVSPCKLISAHLL